jgi:uncharacterized membrane protein
MILERNLSIIMIVFSSFFLVMSLQLENRAGNLIAPGSWPAALMVLMLILSVILLARTFSKKNSQNIQINNREEDADDNDEEKLVYPKRFFLLFITLAIYTFILGYVGFIVATILGIFVMSFLFGMKSPIRALITGIFAVAGSIVLFPILLNLPFPRGVGIFQMFSLLFY